MGKYVRGAAGGGYNYNVYEGTSQGHDSDRVASLVTGTTFQVTGLAAGTTYYFEVTAVDAAGAESSRSNEAQATTELPAPTGLTARVVSSSEVDLSWTAPPSSSPPPVNVPDGVHSGALLVGKYVRGAAGGGYSYNVYEGTSSGGESGTAVNSGPVAGTAFQVTGLAAGTTYYFEVAAVDAVGAESGRSNEARATTPSSGGGSAVPAGLSARVVSSSEVDLSWTAPGSGAAGGGYSYNVYEGTSSGGESGTAVNSGPVAGTAFQVTGLAAGTTYYFEVAAVDAVGAESGRSNEARATTTAGSGGQSWGVLVGLAVIVAAIVGALAVWRRIRRPPPPAPPVIKAVPDAGSPPAISIHATGTGATHTVRIESHPGPGVTTIEEVRPR